MSFRMPSLGWIATALFVVALATGVGAQPNGINLEYVEGVSVYDSTEIPTGRSIAFYIRLNNASGHWFNDASHGFDLYSPDGAMWTPHTHYDSLLKDFPSPHWEVDTNLYGEWLGPDIASVVWTASPPTTCIFDAPVPLWVKSYTDGGLFGQGHDTVGFLGYSQGAFAFGNYDGLNSLAFSITLDSVGQGSIGKSLCIDSAKHGSVGLWLWANGITYKAPWDGPHCFEIVDCCLGMRGNVDGDFSDEVSIPDLTTYVSWAYKGGPTPPCMDEVDVNGDGSVDTADLGYLVAFMFKGGAAPVACQ